MMGLVAASQYKRDEDKNYVQEKQKDLEKFLNELLLFSFLNEHFFQYIFLKSLQTSLFHGELLSAYHLLQP